MQENYPEHVVSGTHLYPDLTEPTNLLYPSGACITDTDSSSIEVRR